MAGSKYYVVRNGRKNGIYRTWEECKVQVDGFSGAVYKSFKSEQDALNYLYGGGVKDSAANGNLNKQKNVTGDSVRFDGAEDVVKAYVDGSFFAETGEFSYGMVIIRDGNEICFAEKVNEPELASMHNVAGEIKGAEAAMQYAVNEGLDAIIIYHDYEGIARWCLGDWKANKAGTKAYKAFYDSIKDKVNIKFVKVKGHSNDKYNDMADELAKNALGI